MAETESSPHPAAPSVCCIVLNWNGWADTLACLDALAAQTYSALRVLVVDNASTDGSVARIRSAHPHVTVIESARNLGFAGGCNLGIRAAAAHGDDFVWLLNNDTLPPPDTCAKLVARALAEPAAGLVGSVLRSMHTPERIQAWGGGRVNPWLGRSTHYTAPTPLGPHSYLTFASVLIPRAVLLRVGLLHEGFFMYWEDADYSLRVTRAGYTLAVAEDTAVLHKEGGTSGPRSPTVDRYSTAAGLRFLRRHSPVPPLSMAVFIAARLASRILRGAGKNIYAVLLACNDFRKQRNTNYRDAL